MTLSPANSLITRTSTTRLRTSSPRVHSHLAGTLRQARRQARFGTLQRRELDAALVRVLRAAASAPKPESRGRRRGHAAPRSR